ncbi:hypothetical protein QBL21_05490 [Streptomyces sp. 184]
MRQALILSALPRRVGVVDLLPLSTGEIQTSPVAVTDQNRRLTRLHIIRVDVVDSEVVGAVALGVVADVLNGGGGAVGCAEVLAGSKLAGVNPVVLLPYPERVCGGGRPGGGAAVGFDGEVDEFLVVFRGDRGHNLANRGLARLRIGDDDLVADLEILDDLEATVSQPYPSALEEPPSRSP